jgi:hypothetical protein
MGMRNVEVGEVVLSLIWGFGLVLGVLGFIR